jgi:hypothetical protein
VILLDIPGAGTDLYGTIRSNDALLGGMKKKGSVMVLFRFFFGVGMRIKVN